MTGAAPGWARRLDDLPRRAAQQFGDKVALISAGRSLTFAEVDDLSDRFAAGLQARGISPGACVSLYAENDWRWAVAYYGIVKAGAVVNPINHLLAPQEVRYIVDDCRASMVATSAIKRDALVAALDGGPSRTIIDLAGSGRGTAAIGFDDLCDTAGAVREVERADTALSTICYTSGTTGHPKGAMLSHRNILTNVRMTALMHGRGRDDVIVSALPLPHVYGNVVLNAAFLTGSTLVQFAAFDAATILAAIEQHRATMFEGVPTMYHYLLQSPALAQTELGSLRLCTVGGQTMPVGAMQAIEARFGCPLIELWGMTELGGLGTTHPYVGPWRHGSIGTTLPFLEARVADLNDPATDLAPGEIGELLVRGAIVMMGYHDAPEATAQAITSDGWLRTGDLARQDADGFLSIVDRKKDMILTAGYNIYPAELERVIALHPAVAMVAVAGVPDVAKGEVPVAFVVVRPGATLEAGTLDAHCRAHLAPYKLPRAIRFVDDLPKTSTGKVMRRALAAHDAALPSQ